MSMERLSVSTLGSLPASVKIPRYQKQAVTAGIVHFGAGNFHRAHQAVYCDDLLNAGEMGWGVIGVSLRSATMRDNMAPQDYLYTQPTLGGATHYRVIGAIQDILVAPENPSAVIHAVARSQTQLVSMTITEKGYCLNNGRIDFNHPDLVHDLASLYAPKTIYGYLAAALMSRYVKHKAPLTVLCCDNINGGGEYLAQGVKKLLSQHLPETDEWLADNVSFCASMVDRVTPATGEALKAAVARELGVDDAAPVAAEPFSQWVIEDNFAGARPPFDQVGAMFVDDIAPYERVKLRFLNAGHSMLAALGYLAGDQYIHQALNRTALAEFTEQALKHDVLPVTDVPDGIDAKEYIAEVFSRFRNENLPYACLQVGTDSSQKIQQRWLPSIDDALAAAKSPDYLAFALAAWVVYIRQAMQAGCLNDPLLEAFSQCDEAEAHLDVERFLVLAGAEQFAYFASADFMAKVQQFQQAIMADGVEPALQQFFHLLKKYETYA